jgi:hypothetical protein
MRIAVCFSGPASRFYEKLDDFGNQLNILKGFSQCDLFFSFSGSGSADEIAEIATKKAQEHLEGSFQVVKVELTDQYPNHSKYIHIHQCWSQGNNPNVMFSMFGGIKRADSLRQAYEKEHDFKYNLVIRSRPDINVVGTPELQKWIHSIHHRCLLIVPKNYNWIEHWDAQGMLNDQWFAANSHTMSMVSALVDHIEEYVDNGCRFHPETLLWWHIKRLPIIPGTDRDYNATPYFRPIDIETVLRGLRGY